MKIAKKQLRQIIKEEISSIVENTDGQTRKISEEERDAFFKAYNRGDPFEIVKAKDMDMSRLAQALGITVIGFFQGQVYFQLGNNKGHDSRLPLHILGKLS